MAAYLMSRHCNMTLRDIANHLGVSTGSSISWHNRRCRQYLQQQPNLRRQLERAEKRLMRTE